MKKHCHGAYEIVEDGEIVVQATGDSGQESGSDAAPTPGEARTEWRIKFTCGEGEPDDSGPH